jgi:hypothetical protein
MSCGRWGRARAWWLRLLAGAGAGLRARAELRAGLCVIGCGTMTLLAPLALAACSASTPSAAGPSSFSPQGTISPIPAISPSPTVSGTENASNGQPAVPGASPTTVPAETPTAPATQTASVTPTASATTKRPATHYPTAAPATGGGGTSGPRDPLLFALGGAALLAGAASIAYHRRAARHR